MARIKLLLMISILLLLAACHHRGRDTGLIQMYNNEVVKRDWKIVLKADPIKKDENVKTTDLGTLKNASFHLIQINGKEEPHTHPDQDLMVIIKKGKGIFYMQGKSFKVKEGAVLMIPKGVEHFYENKCGCGSAAIAIFSPALN